MSEDNLRAAIAYIALAGFVLFTTLGGFTISATVGFYTLGVTSLLTAFLLGSVDNTGGA